jgi:aryl-alcohol dehydrogenase-like predicted oxidoreductase
MAAERGCTLSQVALAWVMGRPGVTSAIIGPRTVAQFEDNWAATEVSLSAEDRQRIDEVTRPGGVLYRPG